jgi:hypothetical protein
VIREELSRLFTIGERHRRLFARLVIAFGLSTVVFAVGTVLIWVFESGQKGGNIHGFGDAAFFCSVQLLTVSSSMTNPVTSAGKIIDVGLEAWAIFVVTAVAGSFATFFSSGDASLSTSVRRYASRTSCSWEALAMAGSGDEMAGAGGHRHPRVSHADREQVIHVLKAAFVQGRLAKDEFDLRIGQALASRTYADLAALTADVPGGPARARPPEPARESKSVPAPKAVARVTAAGTGASMALIGAELIANGEILLSACSSSD